MSGCLKFSICCIVSYSDNLIGVSDSDLFGEITVYLLSMPCELQQLEVA
jgi:hypothetical protein